MRTNGLGPSDGERPGSRPKPLTVGFYCDRWPTFHPMHGPARYVMNLADELVCRGVSVHIVTAEPGPPRVMAEHGYTLYTFPLKPLRFISRFQPGIGESLDLAHQLRRLHAKVTFDVFEFTNVEGIGFESCRVGAFPTVIRVHTTAFDALRIGAARPRLEAGYARLERWAARRANLLVTHSLAHRDQAARDYGVRPDTMHVVPHGIPARLGGTRVTRLDGQILSVGAASPRKGVGEFLEAAALLSEHFPTVRFVWAGNDTPTSPRGTLWEDYARMQYPRLHGRLSFRGGLTDPELAKLYQESTCYLCTAKYESFGMTLVEAMLAGLPVIAPRGAAMQEVVRDNETGWLFAPNDLNDLVQRVRTVLASPDARSQVASQAQQQAVDRFSAATMATRMLELYDIVRSR